MKNHMTRFLSRVLVLLMMLQLVSVGPVFATSASAENDEAEQEEILANDAEDDVEEAAPAEEPAEEEPVEEPVLTLRLRPTRSRSRTARPSSRPVTSTR